MRRLVVVVAAFALGPPSGALAHSGHAVRRPVDHKGSQHRLALGGKLASIDGKAKVAVLSLGGARGKLVALDLSSASVRVTSKHGLVKAGALDQVRMLDRVIVKLKVSAKVARADAEAGIPAPVAELVDQHPCATRPHSDSESAIVSGVVGMVNGNAVSVTLGDGANATTVTLDLSSAQVYAGRPPAPAEASSIVAGDRVLANLAISYDTLRADLQSGTPMPVVKLYDVGAPPAIGGGGDEAHPLLLGGTITALADGQVTISFGDAGNVHTAVLDISSAAVFAGTHVVTATASSASALSVGDRVYAVLSVPSAVASGDVQSGTPIPVAKLYDAGIAEPPAPPTPPTPPTPPPSQIVILGGTITALADGQVTISFGDAGNVHTAVLDISSAAVFAGSHIVTATASSASALNVGDRVYAVLSVSSAVASGNVQAGTPIPVAKLYDAGAPKPPTAG